MPEPPTRTVHDLPAPRAPDIFERSEDPKGWDRASVRYRSHPLHPFPKVTQADFILPPAGDRLRLLGDSVVFGACVALLCFFPLWVANVLAVGRLGNWVWGAMAVAGVLGAVFLFVASGRAEREFQKFLASL